MTNILPLILFICLSFQLTACARNSGEARTNQPETTPTPDSQPKTVEVPSRVKNAVFEPNPDENILLLTLNRDNRIFYQDKQLDDAALKAVLTEYSEKHKKDPSTTGSKLPPYLVENAKSFYIKADVSLPFAQILKVLKAVQASSPTSYRAKFIVQPAEEAGKTAKTPNGRYVVNFDLGIPEKNNAMPRPNPLFLAMKLDAAGKITLNNSLVERSRLKDTLLKIFKEREQYGAFLEGTNEVDKRLTLFPAPDVKYGDVIKLVDELNETLAKVEFGDLRNYMTEPTEVKLD
jgi:biopolymer transport protein ExbD